MSKGNLESSAAACPGACGQLLPTVEALDGQRDGTIAARVPAGRRLLRVLIVDDNRDATDSMAMLVGMWGHEVRRAYDGEAALAMASACRPDVLLLDVAMPRMDGCHLARELRRQTLSREALLIAITGYADEAHRLICKEAGFDHVLAKPVEPSVVENLMMLHRDRLAELPESFHVTPRKCGILVVDDEASMRGMLNIGMREQGFAVWAATGGQEALDLYQRHHESIDVVLMDVRMPGLDGPQTLAALQAVNPQVRCCFMSGDLGSYTEERLKGLGAAAIHWKPFPLDEVARSLWQLAGNGDGVRPAH